VKIDIFGFRFLFVLLAEFLFVVVVVVVVVVVIAHQQNKSKLMTTKLLDLDLLLKVLLMGDSGTAKSTFREKLVNDLICDFTNLRPTQGLDVSVDSRLLGSKLVKSQIFDISGSSTTFAKVMLKGVVHVAFLFVDVQRESTFETAKAFLKMLSNNTLCKPMIVFVGAHLNTNNDVDVDVVDISNDVAAFARAEQCLFFEFNASTITPAELNELYNNVVESYIVRQQQQLQLQLQQQFVAPKSAEPTTTRNTTSTPILSTKQGFVVTLKTMLDSLTI
jgi:hypothetical protein